MITTMNAELSTEVQAALTEVAKLDAEELVNMLAGSDTDSHLIEQPDDPKAQAGRFVCAVRDDLIAFVRLTGTFPAPDDVCEVAVQWAWRNRTTDVWQAYVELAAYNTDHADRTGMSGDHAAHVLDKIADDLLLCLVRDYAPGQD